MTDLRSADDVTTNVTPIHRSGEVLCPDRLLRLPQVLDSIGLSRSMLYKMMKAGEFPQPRKVRHASLWVEAEVQQWIKNIVASVVDD
ncbi:AlpA family phage regulatory protein [Paraburkholderia sp. SARCC-3016]|uniref:helix-turn-helix transcriptional regulator n=1 Tax=Paraburkholderia sp. SARCC-3016 TaxID=3058611 RepID=UPI002808ADA4|nr:AlpA family phage regulatory protein [Paraburkholderia sp. SARCC-3016]MDQ7981945.1 AlpA family phage regulatory protein [Paraburkholderia sp. SARCC-3016]